jgi:prevent-host-death family protein
MSIKMKNIISITEARKEIFAIAEKVQKTGNHYIFTEDGKPKLAVMSADEYENLMEDLALSADPKFRARIEKAHEDIARGDYVIWSDVKAGLDRNKNLVVADKAKKGYSVKKTKKNKK